MTYEVIRKKNLSLPITIEEAKKQVSLETSFIEDDVLLERYIKSAERFCSGILGSDIAETEVTHKITNYLGGKIRVKEYPLISISSIKYYDSTNAERVLSGTEYLLLEDQFYFDITLPADIGGENHKLEIKYKTGNAKEDINPDFISAIEIKVATLYDHERENFSDYKLKSNRAIQNLLAPYMRLL
tara:strand:+ start:185 stop:742 length:558 start_codon:yes stop_codon:yes gene_type:complete